MKRKQEEHRELVRPLVNEDPDMRIVNKANIEAVYKINARRRLRRQRKPFQKGRQSRRLKRHR